MNAATSEECPDGSAWPALPRVRRTIVVADMVESVRLLQHDEARVIDRWRRLVHQIRSEVLARHSGELVKSLGDGLLLSFEHAPQAAAAALAILRTAAAGNVGLAPDVQIQLRLGMHVADVVADELDVYGAGVNLAARIASVAPPGGIAASADVVDELLPGIDAHFSDAGRCYFKHVDSPVQTYFLSPVVDRAEQPGLFVPHASSSTSGAAPGRRAQLAQPSLVPCVAMLSLAPHDAAGDVSTCAELVTDLLLTRLSTVHALRIISRLSTLQFARRGLGAADIAQLTGATYLIGGRLVDVSGRFHLFLELIDAATQEILWAHSGRFDVSALLATDENITPPLAQMLVERIVAHQMKRVTLSPLPNLDSQSLHFAAIHLAHRQLPADFARAGEILSHLTERHPRAASPHAWLAKWHVLRVTKGVSVDVADEGQRALDHTRRALDLDPHLTTALVMDAFVQCHLRQDLAAAVARLDQAEAMSPSEPWVWLVRSTVESLLGRGDAAWEATLRARELSPLDPLRHYFDALAASAAVSAERWADAMSLAALALSKDARHLPTLRALTIAQVHSGQMDDARKTMARVLGVQPGFTLARYLDASPRGSEAIRRRWADAMRAAGAPDS